jgi:hypothetical protein
MTYTGERMKASALSVQYEFSLLNFVNLFINSWIYSEIYFARLTTKIRPTIFEYAILIFRNAAFKRSYPFMHAGKNCGRKIGRVCC